MVTIQKKKTIAQAITVGFRSNEYEQPKEEKSWWVY